VGKIPSAECLYIVLRVGIPSAKEHTPSGGNLSNRVVSNRKNFISGMSSLEGLQRLEAKILFYSILEGNTWN